MNEEMPQDKKSQRIQQELERQVQIYSNQDERMQAKLLPFLKQLAFLSVMIDDKKSYLSVHGVVEKKQTSKGVWTETVSAHLESYQALLRSFSDVQEQIETLIK